MAIFGWKTMKEAERYTRAAHQKSARWVGYRPCQAKYKSLSHAGQRKRSRLANPAYAITHQIKNIRVPNVEYGDVMRFKRKK
jgi:hypothetical protein